MKAKYSISPIITKFACKKKHYTQDIEELLIVKAQNGNVEAENRLIESHIKFIIGEAIKKHNANRKTIPVDDLITECIIGFKLAIEQFQFGRNSKLISYAFFKMKSQMNKYINELSRVVRIPQCEVEKIRREFKDIKNKNKTCEEIGDLFRQTELLNTEIIDDNNLPYEYTKEQELKVMLDNAISTLSPVEQTIINTQFLVNQDLTLSDIGELIGCQKARNTGMIKNKALKKLSSNIKLKEYFSSVN